TDKDVVLALRLRTGGVELPLAVEEVPAVGGRRRQPDQARTESDDGNVLHRAAGTGDVHARAAGVDGEAAGDGDVLDLDAARIRAAATKGPSGAAGRGPGDRGRTPAVAGTSNDDAQPCGVGDDGRGLVVVAGGQVDNAAADLRAAVPPVGGD